MTLRSSATPKRFAVCEQCDTPLICADYRSCRHSGTASETAETTFYRQRVLTLEAELRELRSIPFTSNPQNGGKGRRSEPEGCAKCSKCGASEGEPCLGNCERRTPSAVEALADQLRRQNPHDTDEVIKLMNAAASALERTPSSAAGQCRKCGMGPLRESCAYPEACEHPCRELALKLNQVLIQSATSSSAAETIDRSDAVNLARNIINTDMHGGITHWGIEQLARAVLKMDAALLSAKEEKP